MQLVLLLSHVRRHLHSVVQNLHHVPRVRHVSLLLIESEKVLRDVLEVPLQYSPPFVPKPKFFKTGLVEGAEVDCPWRHGGFDCFCQVFFFEFVSCWNNLQVSSEDFLVAEEKVGELLQGQVRVIICLDGAGVEGCRQVQRCRDPDFVETVVEVLHADATLVPAIPLVENAVQVRPRGVLPSQSTSDVHHMLLVDRFLECQGLICSILLSLEDGLFEPLGRTVASCQGETSSLVRVHCNVSLVGLIDRFGSGPCVVSCEDLVGPLGVLQLGRFLVRHEDGCLRTFALSVIKLQLGVFFRVLNLQSTCHFKAVFAHGADIRELHGGVEPLLLLEVSLGSEVDVCKTTLVRTLLPHVHLCLLSARLIISNQIIY